MPNSLEQINQYLDLCERAWYFAEHKHAGKFRENRIDPYTTHLQSVVDILESLDCSDNVYIAGLLHDTLEDTITTKQEIAQYFNVEVADLVHHLSDHFTKEYYPKYNRKERKELEFKRLAECNAEVQTIKLADAYANLMEIEDLELRFALIYVEEKKLLLKCLTKADPRVILMLSAALDKVRLKVIL